MKKLILLLGLFLVYVSGIAQPVTARSSSVITVMDSRFFAQYNFRPPVFPDTTAANVQKGLDSCGALIFTYDYNGYWYRACSPKRWLKISQGNDTAYVTSQKINDSTFILCKSNGICDTITITGNYWSLSGNDVSSIASPKLGTTSSNSLSIVTNDIERINISDTGLVKITNLQTNTSQDTATYKPIGVNSAGEITKMDSWVGGAIPNLQQVTDAGNMTTTPITIASDLNNSIGQVNKLHISDVDNSFFMDSATIDFRADYSIGNSYSDIILGTHINPSINARIYADAGNSFSIVQNSLGYTQIADNNGVYVGDWIGNQINVRNNSINFQQTSGNNISYYPLYPNDANHFCALPLTIPTQITDTIATLRDIRTAGGGTGTVTSISQGYGISNSPNPITTTGTISVDTVTLSGKYLRIVDTTNKWVSSVTKVNDSTIRVVKDGTTNDLTFTTATNATRLVTQVWNSTGATITKGSVIYINGAHSSILPSIALAKANAESTSAYTYGLVVNDISDNSEGTVIQNGAITNLNLPTTSYTDGQTLYLSPTIAGGYTTTKPTAPNHYVAIGTVTRAHPVFGTIQVAIRNGFQLDEMSDVQIPQVPNDSTLLQFSRVDSLWHAVSPTNAIGSRYIKPSDTATMLTNYPRGSGIFERIPYWTASRTLTASQNYIISSTLTAPSIQVSSSNFQSKAVITPISISANKSATTDYAGLYVDTVNNIPYQANYNLTNNKESRLYPTKLTFGNLNNGSTVTINAPASTSNRTINFQDKSYTIADSADVAAKVNTSQGRYSMLANNTNATANMSSQPFYDAGSQTYSGTITWNQTGTPSGTTNHSYRWTQIGKLVTLHIVLIYGTASTVAQTTVTMSLPTDCPTPITPSGMSASNTDIMYFGNGSFYPTINALSTSAAFFTALRGTASGGFEFVVSRTGSLGSIRYVNATIQYFTNTTY